MKLSMVKKISLKVMVVFIVTRNSTDDNNHGVILSVILHYRIIKYQYVNIIQIFIFSSVFSLLLDSFMFLLLKEELGPKCI